MLLPWQQAIPRPLAAARRYHIIQCIFVSGELSVQYCFRRTFFWSHAWLHPNDLPCDSLVVLSSHDTVRATQAAAAPGPTVGRDLCAGQPAQLTPPLTLLTLTLRAAAGRWPTRQLFDSTSLLGKRRALCASGRGAGCRCIPIGERSN